MELYELNLMDKMNYLVNDNLSFREFRNSLDYLFNNLDSKSALAISTINKFEHFNSSEKKIFYRGLLVFKNYDLRGSLNCFYMNGSIDSYSLTLKKSWLKNLSFEHIGKKSFQVNIRDSITKNNKEIFKIYFNEGTTFWKLKKSFLPDKKILTVGSFDSSSHSYFK